jgi:chromosome segregation ATPase
MTLVSGGVSGAISTRQARAAFLKETAQMVKDMSLTVADQGEGAHGKQVSKLMRHVFDIRREYDQVRHEARTRGEEFARVCSEHELLLQQERGVRSMSEQLTSRLKEIEMRLKTVTIKISETGENRQNYQTNIVHLKEEDFDNFNQLKTLRKQSHDNQAFFRKLHEIRHAATTDKAQAEAELADFRGEVQQFQAFVQDQFAQFEHILHVMRVQGQKRERAKQEVAERGRQKLGVKIEALQEDVKETEEESQALQAKLSALELKLRHFEDSFAKVAAATGLTAPDAIVNKYFFKSEIKHQLQQEIDEKERYKQSLKEREAQLKSELAERVNNKGVSTWRDVDQKRDEVREKSSKSRKAQVDQVNTAQRLAFIQEGILALSKSISSVTLQQHGDFGYADAPEVDGLWTADVADRLLTKIHVDIDSIIEVEKEINNRAQIEASSDDAHKVTLASAN